MKYLKHIMLWSLFMELLYSTSFILSFSYTLGIRLKVGVNLDQRKPLS
ncbi:hypothetical protein Taro_033774 [Colocasia esculenta]|uniref:Uncharacterized protein n=1 Tax=Colocasia esculenta TaxID=4460 RepID=A0A843VUQ2_COLES|nr:hypothetical protein [Colocasia esculenta]